jgi:hypothetical protein
MPRGVNDSVRQVALTDVSKPLPAGQAISEGRNLLRQGPAQSHEDGYVCSASSACFGAVAARSLGTRSMDLHMPSVRRRGHLTFTDFCSCISARTSFALRRARFVAAGLLVRPESAQRTSVLEYSRQKSQLAKCGSASDLAMAYVGSRSTLDPWQTHEATRRHRPLFVGQTAFEKCQRI